MMTQEEWTGWGRRNGAGRKEPFRYGSVMRKMWVVKRGLWGGSCHTFSLYPVAENAECDCVLR